MKPIEALDQIVDQFYLKETHQDRKHVVECEKLLKSYINRTTWRKCSDGLPEVNQRILVKTIHTKDIYSATFCETGFYLDHVWTRMLDANEMTHWQPLPEAPGGEE